MPLFPLDQVPPYLVDALTKIHSAYGPGSPPFALGGAFSLAVYTGLWRDSKDIDLYTLPEDRDLHVQILKSHGYRDYYDDVSYDRSWIFRAVKDEVIVDVIFSSANGVFKVTRDWLVRGPDVDIAGFRAKVIPPEELIWSKVYVLQKSRCDWTDLFNVIYCRGENLDWRRLIDSVGEEDQLLLNAIMHVFVWLAPGQAARFPDWLWGELNVLPPPGAELIDRKHVSRLDSRPWFVPLVRSEQGKKEGAC